MGPAIGFFQDLFYALENISEKKGEIDGNGNKEGSNLVPNLCVCAGIVYRTGVKMFALG